jgi:endonuclease G, mitochondrial
MLAVAVAIAFLAPPVNENVMYGYPRAAKSPDTTLLVRKGFTLLHDNRRKGPLWVSFRLKKSYISSNARSGTFKADAELSPGSRAELDDYRSSGFDRGHMAASGDMRRSLDIQKESFYLSNILPQNPDLNQGIWADIESIHRSYATAYDDVTVVVGPVYDRRFADGPPQPASGPIGANRVAIPTGFFRIVLRRTAKDKYEALALELPNRSVSRETPLERFICSVDDVELHTGLNFFNALPASVQSKFEAKKPSKLW